MFLNSAHPLFALIYQSSRNGFGFVVKCSAQVRGFFPTMLYMLKKFRLGGAGGGGGAGGAIAPQISRWGGSAPLARYHQVLIASACSSRLLYCQ